MPTRRGRPGKDIPDEPGRVPQPEMPVRQGPNATPEAPDNPNQPGL